MKYQYIIEYAILALLVLVPVFAMVNPANQFRLNRIDEYLNFPKRYQDYTPTDQLMIEQARDHLLKNAGDKFYEPTGLSCFGKEYIEREQELFTLLAQLACLPQGTWNLYYIPFVRECKKDIQQDALELINATITNDVRLFDYTARNFNCAVSKEGTFLEYGKRVVECACGSQNWK